jgi:hypothetical protein
LKILDTIFETTYKGKYKAVGILDHMPTTPLWSQVWRSTKELKLLPTHVVLLGLVFFVSLLFYLLRGSRQTHVQPASTLAKQE